MHTVEITLDLEVEGALGGCMSAMDVLESDIYDLIENWRWKDATAKLIASSTTINPKEEGNEKA